MSRDCAEWRLDHARGYRPIWASRLQAGRHLLFVRKRAVFAPPQLSDDPTSGAAPNQDEKHESEQLRHSRRPARLTAATAAVLRRGGAARPARRDFPPAPATVPPAPATVPPAPIGPAGASNGPAGASSASTGHAAGRPLFTGRTRGASTGARGASTGTRGSAAAGNASAGRAAGRGARVDEVHAHKGAVMNETGAGSVRLRQLDDDALAGRSAGRQLEAVDCSSW